MLMNPVKRAKICPNQASGNIWISLEPVRFRVECRSRINIRTEDLTHALPVPRVDQYPGVRMAVNELSYTRIEARPYVDLPVLERSDSSWGIANAHNSDVGGCKAISDK